MINPYQLQEIINSRDKVRFAVEILGMPVHKGQKYWAQNNWRKINILKPANQWGKTTWEAIEHIFHNVCKPQLDRLNPDYPTWYRTRYETLNFGKTYEVAKGVMEAVVDIVEGNYLLNDGTFNKSLLAGWAIRKIDDTPKLPRICFFNNSFLLIRSYDDLGSSFKRKKLAFISGDECGDIQELNLFLHGTLMPRTFFWKAPIHLVGTSQPKGLEYEELAEQAEKEMKEKGEKANMFILSANLLPEMASIYQNDFMPPESIAEIEATADPELKKQIIYGFYVDYSDHLYTWEEVSKMFSPGMDWDIETGISEEPVDAGYYVFYVDMAASKDETSMTGIRYNIQQEYRDGTIIQFPHRVVYHRFWKGETMPLAIQYEILKEDFMHYKRISPKRCSFGYDAGSLGGKNAEQAFKELHGYPFPPKGRSYADAKGEMFGVVKEVLGRNRRFDVNEAGKKVDRFPDWGGIRASQKLRELRRQIESSSKDDDKLKNDQFTSFAMALHHVERRAPKRIQMKAVDFNFARLNNTLTA